MTVDPKTFRAFEVQGTELIQDPESYLDLADVDMPDGVRPWSTLAQIRSDSWPKVVHHRHTVS